MTSPGASLPHRILARLLALFRPSRTASAAPAIDPVGSARRTMAAATEQPPAPGPVPTPAPAAASGAAPPLSEVLPPLILGTATFNTQYVADPSSMPYTAIVGRALELGVAGFDTSPYYGPSELLLGDALRSLAPPRGSYFLITKAGRVGPAEFDYSPAWIRRSVLRSLRRLGADRLDLVYTHDVEFVDPADALAAVRELRRLRDEGLVRYVGISGYPVRHLCLLAEMVRRETGEPLDAVMSYCHGSVQNGELVEGFDGDEGGGEGPGAGAAAADPAAPLARLRAAGVSVVLNASMLGMGLLTTRGVDHGPQAAWHPSPPPLRRACAAAAAAAARAGETLEKVAIRYSLDTFARAAAAAGLGVRVPGAGGPAVGASVMGVSSLGELEETCGVWRSVLAGLAPGGDDGGEDGDGERALSLRRRDEIRALVRGTLWPLLGEWRDYSWASPEEGFVNQRGETGVVPAGEAEADEAETEAARR